MTVRVNGTGCDDTVSPASHEHFYFSNRTQSHTYITETIQKLCSCIISYRNHVNRVLVSGLHDLESFSAPSREEREKHAAFYLLLLSQILV